MIKSRLQLLLMAGLLAVGTGAIALEKIRHVLYVPDRVVPIYSSLFHITTVVFSPSESVQSIQCGDMAAWVVDVDRSQANTLFIKPTVAASDTNMTVTTNRHRYYFHIHSAQKSLQSVYGIQFSYHEDKPETQHFAALSPNQYHWAYTFHGSRHILPIHVFDDGVRTYFQLRAHQVVPAFFIVTDSKGHESLVNYRRHGHYIEIPKLARQFTLRSGQSDVVSIFNHNNSTGYHDDI